MMCTSRLFSRLLEQGSDQEVGRWAWMRFKANDDFNYCFVLIVFIDITTNFLINDYSLKMYCAIVDLIC